MLHRKKRESILSWVQSAGGTDVENLKQLSDGILYFKLIKTLVDTSDESPDKVNIKDPESICESHPKDKEQGTNGESGVADIQISAENGATNFNHFPKNDSDMDTEEPSSHPLGEISYDENRMEKDSEADIDNITSDKNENSPCQEIVNGHEDGMIANKAVIAVLNLLSETVANLHADAISKISVNETSNSGHTDDIIENAVPETDAGQLIFGTVENSDSNTNLYCLNDAIVEQSVSRKENFDQVAVENTSDTIISNNGSDCKSMVSDEATREVTDNVNQNHSCWGLSQTNNDLSTLSNVVDSEISEPKHLNSIDEEIEEIENIEKRYNVIQKFIENMLELKSLNLVSYEECQKGVELEIAKVTVLLLSAMVQYSLSVNKGHVLATCSGLPPEDQEEIMDCLELFLEERESAIEKKEFDLILARTARPRITPVKSTPKIAPKKSRSRVRSSSSRKRRKSIILETDSMTPIQKLIKSPCLRQNTPDSEARLLDALQSKEKYITTLQYDLDTEKFNADDLRNENEQLNFQLSKSRAEIEKLKSSLRDTQNNLDNQIISSETMKNDLESKIKRYLEQIKELKNDVDFYREKSLVDDSPAPQSSNCNCSYEISELKTINLLKEDKIQELTKQKLDVEFQLTKLLAEKKITVKMDTNSPEDMSEKEKCLNTLDLTTKTQIQDKCDELQEYINSQKYDYEMKMKSLREQLLAKENELQTLKGLLWDMEKEKEAAEKMSKSLKKDKTLLEQKLETLFKKIPHNLTPNQSNTQQHSEQLIQNTSGQALTKRRSLRNQSISDSEKIGTLWATFSKEPQAPQSHAKSLKQETFEKSSSLEKLPGKGPIKILHNKNMHSISHDIHLCNKFSKSTTIDSLSISEEELHDLQQSVIELHKDMKSRHFLYFKHFDIFENSMANLCSLSTISSYLRYLIQFFTLLLNSYPGLSDCINFRRFLEMTAESSDSSEAKETAHRVDKTVNESEKVDKVVNESEAEDERLIENREKDSLNVINGADFENQALSRCISDLQSQKDKIKEELFATENLLAEEKEKAKSFKLNFKKSKLQEEIKIKKLQEKLTISENAKKEYLQKLEESLAENDELKEKFSKEGFERTIFYLKEDLKSFKSENLALRCELKRLKEQNKKLQDDLDDEKRNNAGAFIPKIFRSAEKLKYENVSVDKKEFSSGFCDDEGPQMSSINNISAIPSAGVNTGRMLWKEDDEEEMFDHGSVSEIFKDSPREREKEFRRRNTLYRPHMKSHYPLELNTTPTQVKYFMPPTPLAKPSNSRESSSIPNDGHVTKKPKMESNCFSRPTSVASHGSRSSLKSLPIYPGYTENFPISTPKENRSFAVKLLKSQNSLRKKIKMDKHHSGQ